MSEVTTERARENMYIAATNDNLILRALAIPGWFEKLTARLNGYPDPDQCWSWTGYKSDGYGRAWSPGSHGERSPLTVHRVVWIATNGLFRAELVLDHDGPAGCHNRACANPGHLRVVTQRVNLAARTGETSELCQRGHRLVPSGAGRRRCRECAMDRNQVIREAARQLGIGFCEYTRTHGWSRDVAEGVLANGRAAA